MASLLAHSPSLLLSPFPNRTRPQIPLLHRTLLHRHNQKPLLRGSLCVVASLGFQPDPESTEFVLRDLFGRAEGILYTLADAAVASSDAVTTTTTTKNNDWFSGIANYMETVLKILKGGLSTLHVPYAYGFAIILLTVLVKAATFPLTKKQMESTMAMKIMQPQIKAIQQRYAGNQERIQLETARLYKLAGINPLAGCLPTLLTIPVWIGLYRALSNVADEGFLTEGFFWIPSLAGPTTVAARQSGSGTSWLFPFVDGHPPLGWHDTLAYLVLPVLLIVSQYISIQIMQSSQPESDDPNMKTSQTLTKVLPLMIGYFALSVPSGLSLYWLTNNILSTAQQVWLQKLGGAKNPINQNVFDIGKNPLDQISGDIQSQIPNSTITETRQETKPASQSQGPRPGERFKQLKEQEERRKRQKEEEKRKAEEAAAKLSQRTDDENVKEANRVQMGNGAGTSLVDERNNTNGVLNGDQKTVPVLRIDNAELSENREVSEKDEQHSHESSTKI